MTNPSDDRELLISAYLDDDLDASARGLVEADADLLAIVEAAANVRALLAERAPVDRARRESVLAAALAAFDARALDATSPDAAAAASTIRPVEHLFAAARSGAGRRRRWLAPVAAAAVAVVGLGVFAATMTDDDDDETTDDAASVLNESASIEAASATELMAEAEVAAEDAAPGAPASGATLAVPGGDTGGAERTATIASPEQLAAFAAELTGAATGPAGDSLQVCGRDVIGLATYVETGAGRAVPVAVYIDAAAGEVVAVDTSTCAAVLRAPAP